MEHIEYEERVMINENDYKKVIDDLLENGFNCDCFTIENIYFDNDEFFIDKNGMMLRIRNTSTGIHELTLKVRQKEGVLEINETLENHPQIDAALNNKFKEFKEIIKLVTKRIEISIDDYLLVIDKNEYLDVIDYDIEIEANTQQRAKEVMFKLCDKYKLRYDENYKVKSARAFERFKKGWR
ncbi:MAG: CYTH domain-containing protein [Bacilli bacterium]|nr:CYTH domain-containing protein [Bacilli bacterium]